MNGLVSEMCACGCGQPVQQIGVGRRRKYVNNTHKSAANNQKTRDLVKRGFDLKEAVLLRHMITMSWEDLIAWYPDLSEAQIAVLSMLKEYRGGYDEIVAAFSEMAGW